MLEVIQKPFAYYLRFNWNKAIIDDIKAIKPWQDRSYVPEEKMWSVSIERKNEVLQIIEKHGGKLIEQTESEKIGDIPPMPELDIEIATKIELRHYQKQGVAYGLEKKRFINGDKPGLGKTAEAIATVFAAQAFPVLCIVPASLRDNWVKEWNKVVGIKAMILEDRVKKTWPTFYTVGMCNVFITSYDSLEKYFVEKINKDEKGKWKISNVVFNKNKDIFKAVIMDEIHKCFPYDTNIQTNKGVFKIGDIVENKMKDLHVQSFNLSNNCLSYKPILNFWKNELRDRKIYTIRFYGGELQATQDHKIFTASGRYKKVSEIKSGEILFILRKEFFSSKKWEKNPKVLQRFMCNDTNEFKLQSSRKNKAQKRKDRNRLRDLSKNIPNFTIRKNKKNNRRTKKILRTQLLCKMENESTTNSSKCFFRKIKPKQKKGSGKSKKQYRSYKIPFGSYEIKQSNEKSRNCAKNERQSNRENISFTWRKWKNDSSTTKTMGSLRITKRIFRVCNKYSDGKKNVYLRSKSLQGGHRNRNTKTSNRSRWGHTQYEEMEILRRTKNRNIKCVRVESIEIQEPTNNGKFRTGINGYKTVYDLEIAENNNYFANGILVSNCKDSKTRAAKLTAGICFQKEYRIGLSGTPILNTPKDLVSQLKTIGQLEAVGGSYKYFINRYCGGDGKGATNLKELNYRLKTACFFQRTTEEVLTELPPKIYQNVYCDITTRKEYNIALNDLSSYLKDFKDKTAREISISMRGEVMVKIGILKQISARGKMEAVTEYIEDLLGAGEKVGLFVHHAEVADFIKGKFPQTLLYTGRQSSAEKNMAVEQFQKCKSCGVMFEDHKGLDHDHEMSDKKLITISTKAGGVGLTLTAARNMGVVELPWHPADCEQIEARFWRMSQTNNVKCTYFLGRNTIDEHIYDIIERKRGVVNAVMGLDDNRQFVDKEEKNLVDNIIKLFNDGKMNVVQ